MTKHSKYKIENSDFCKLTRQELFEYIVELHDWLERSAWQGLTDEEISALEIEHVDYELFDEGEYGTECNVYVKEFARAIEQALKEKNT